MNALNEPIIRQNGYINTTNITAFLIMWNTYLASHPNLYVTTGGPIHSINRLTAWRLPSNADILSTCRLVRFMATCCSLPCPASLQKSTLVWLMSRRIQRIDDERDDPLKYDGGSTECRCICCIAIRACLPVLFLGWMKWLMNTLDKPLWMCVWAVTDTDCGLLSPLMGQRETKSCCSGMKTRRSTWVRRVGVKQGCCGS